MNASSADGETPDDELFDLLTCHRSDLCAGLERHILYFYKSFKFLGSQKNKIQNCFWSFLPTFNHEKGQRFSISVV